MPKKTVYILGAGASKAVGLPLQAQLLSSIFSLEPPKFDMQKDFMELTINDRQETIFNFYPEFVNQREILADFIVSAFSSETFSLDYRNACNSGNYGLALSLVKQINVTLEDLFTLFDKVSLGHEHFKTYTPQEMEEIHTALKKCIIFILVYQSALLEQDSSAYSILAKKLIDRRLEATAKEDILAVITMNWDSVLEQELYRQCENYNSGKSIRALKIYPDLCFYDYPLQPCENRIVSTHIKAKGHRNIKLLKLHGSTNWLICPFCGRVFVDYKSDIAVLEYAIKCFCPYCSEEIKTEGNDDEHAPKLRSMLITPTFLKDLNNLHLKNIWHNAFIDIAEADQLVFIGYSFPDADFEMRCLLKKAVRANTEINVVLHSSDNPQYYRDSFTEKGFSEDEINSLMLKFNLPHFRYASFFNKDRLSFHYEGIEAYLGLI
jgi:hypothetical protein